MYFYFVNAQISLVQTTRRHPSLGSLVLHLQEGFALPNRWECPWYVLTVLALMNYYVLVFSKLKIPCNLCIGTHRMAR